MRCAILITTITLFATLASADTLRVPADHSTIQDAISAASNGDIIEVSPGTWYGPEPDSLTFWGKAITVRSTDGPLVTTILNQGLGSVLVFENGEGPDSVLEGFTLTGGAGRGLEYKIGGGILCIDSSPTIRGNIITGNRANQGAGINLGNSSAVVVDNVIFQNVASSYGGIPGLGAGVAVGGGSCEIRNNLIYENSASYGGGLYLSSGSHTLTNNTIFANTAASGAGVRCRLSTVTMTNNIFWANVPDQIENSSSTIDVRYSCVQYSWPGVGNIHTDPQFSDSANADFHLRQSPCESGSQSPCVDTGSPTTPPVAGTTRSCGGEDSSTVDMGYHYPSAGGGEEGDVFEPNDGPSNATETDDGSFFGLRIDVNDTDWFKMWMHQGQELELSIFFSHAQGDLDLRLYDPDVNPLVSSDSVDDFESVRWTAERTGFYFAEVFGYQGATNDYDMGVGITGGDEPGSLSQLQHLRASDEATEGRFGFKVVVSGDFAVVGAIGDSTRGSNAGAAYIYRLQRGSWVEEQKLAPADLEPWDQFGYSVAISGDLIVVGAHGTDLYQGNDAGAAYVYRRSESGWLLEQRLIAIDPTASDRFGCSVAVDDEEILVGSRYDDDLANASGSAYLFLRDREGNWVFWQKLTASDGSAGDNFGMSVSFDNGAAVIGAIYDDDTATNAGAAYVFRREGYGFVEEQKLVASDGADGDIFGWSVSIDGSVVVVGAREDDDRGDRSGSAYVYRYNGHTWVEEQKLTASDGETVDLFGESVDVDGDLVVVGADLNDDLGSSSGSVYVFRRDGIRWNEAQKLTANDGAEGDYFGGSVSLNGNVLLVGGVGNDDAGSSSGSAYVFGVIPDDGFEQNDDSSQASEVAHGAYSDLRIRSLDDDWFKVWMEQGQTITVSVFFAHAEGDLDMQLLDPYLQTLASSTSVSDNETVMATDLASSGFYFVRGLRLLWSREQLRTEGHPRIPCRLPELREGLAGANGLVPQLTGVEGSSYTGGYRILIGNTPGGSPGLLWVSLGLNDYDYYGGHFYPDLGANPSPCFRSRRREMAVWTFEGWTSVGGLD